MDAPPSDFRLLRFWSDDFPVHMRLPAWQEVLGRKLLRAAVRPDPEVPFTVDASLRILSDLRFGVGMFGPSVTHRAPDVAQADSGDYYFLVDLEGPLDVAYAGSNTTLGDGDAMFLATGREVSLTRRIAGRLLVLRLKGERLAALVPDIDDCAGSFVSRDVEPLRLLCTYLKGLDDNQALHTLELRRLVTTQVFDLSALVLKAARGMRPNMQPRALGLLRLRAIKTYIEQRLDQPDLSIADVAETHGLSPRHVQRFFKGEGLTFSEFVLARRLQKVHAALADPRQAHRSVSDIALSAGFGDVSHFNRAFRSHYGASPTEVRHKAVLERGEAPG
jgi:AraC-like DNA-binding protein